MTAPVPPTPASLDEWIAAHGPLAPAPALAIAMHTCAQASGLRATVLADRIGSLTTAAFVRSPSGGWSWVPASNGSRVHPVPDAEVLERIGAVLFHCLSGKPHTDLYASESAVTATLRLLRPDVAPAIADLTARALTARAGSGLTLLSFASDLAPLLGVPKETPRVRARRVRQMAIALAGVLAIVLGAAWTSGRLGEPSGTSGLTTDELAASDVIAEEAQVLALMDEHTAAVGVFQDLARLWRTRLPPDDPRLAWNEVHGGWVRTLAGDRLTTEQLLENKPELFASRLGEGHPYTRAVRLALAAVLEARGATADAARHRLAAERVTRSLFERITAKPVLQAEVPAAPGVIAHVAPNRPEHEGFRQAPDGRFFVPLTSVQRLIAGRDGWRLHLVADGPCQTSFVPGNHPQPVAVHVMGSPAAGWRLEIEGTQPRIAVDVAGGGPLGLSLVADGSGVLRTSVGDQPPRVGRLDPTTIAPNPPYSLSFQGTSTDSGCAIVWLEIPFPHTAVRATSTAPAPAP